MTAVVQSGKPAFHRMMIFQRRHYYASRIPLPARKTADGPASQVFLVMYRDVVQPDE